MVVVLKTNCAMDDLCHTKKGGVSKSDIPNPPSALLFHAKLYLIIGNYCLLIWEASLSSLISHMFPLYLSRHVTRLVMVLLCLIYIKYLDWPSRALHSPNYF